MSIKLIKITTGQSLDNINNSPYEEALAKFDPEQPYEFQQSITIGANGRVYFTSGANGREKYANIGMMAADEILNVVECAIKEIDKCKLGTKGSLWNVWVVYNDDSILEVEALGVGNIEYLGCDLSKFIRNRVKIDNLWLFEGKGISSISGRLNVFSPGKPGEPRQCTCTMDLQKDGSWHVDKAE